MAPIIAFTDLLSVRLRLNMRYGVVPLPIDLGAEPEASMAAAFAELKSRKLAAAGDLVVVVSDIRAPGGGSALDAAGIVRSVQVRRVA